MEMYVAALSAWKISVKSSLLREVHKFHWPRKLWMRVFERVFSVVLTTWTLLCKLPAKDAFSGCFLSAFLAAFFALFSRKRFCRITVSTLCCSQAPVNDWSNRGPQSVWCVRYCPIRFFSRSSPLLDIFDKSGACCTRMKANNNETTTEIQSIDRP